MSSNVYLAPDQLYSELFTAVQTKKIFPDSKTFADACPKIDPFMILAEYKKQMESVNKSLMIAGLTL